MGRIAVLALALGSCASPDLGGDSDAAARGGGDLARPDLATRDLARAPDLACALGTPDHCGRCDQVCPGPDDATTRRSCAAPDLGAARACDIVCQGEYYDEDGLLANGCEASDAPVRDSARTAVKIVLPDSTQPNQNPKNLVYQLLSDGRVHAEPPLRRPLGRDNWFAVTVDGLGFGLGMQACLSIVSLPVDNRFEVCLSDIGLTTFDDASCGTVSGGQGQGSVCVLPPSMSNAGSPYYVRVRRLAGSPTLNGYALYLKH
jgi:hypothetical protein